MDDYDTAFELLREQQESRAMAQKFEYSMRNDVEFFKESSRYNEALVELQLLKKEAIMFGHSFKDITDDLFEEV